MSDDQLRAQAAEMVLHVRRGAWHATEVQQYLGNQAFHKPIVTR